MSEQVRMLPQSKEAETGVLGMIMVFPDEMALVADRLRPEHFYREKNRLIYEAMMHLYELQESPDQFSVVDLLERRGQLETIGGVIYCNDLVQEIATSGKLETYAQRIIDTALLRGVIATGGQMVQLAWDAGDVPAQEILEQAESLIYDLSRKECVSDEVASAGDVFTAWFEEFDAAGEVEEGTVTGVPTGLRDLDRLTGGFQRSDLIVLAGRPGTGKTSLCMSIARATAMLYRRGVFISSLEMSKQQLIQRLVSMEAGIDVQRLMLRRVTDEERARVVNSAQAIINAPIYIDDTPGLSISQLRSKLRREMAKHPIDLVIVDFLQLLTATIDGKRVPNRFNEVSEVARGLKNLGKEFDVPVLALSQLSRAVEGRQSKVPQLSDLRESGEIEQAADLVFFIYRDDLYAGINKETGKSLSDRPGTADIVCAKHRNGPTGEILVGFDKTQTRYFDLETQLTGEE